MFSSVERAPKATNLPPGLNGGRRRIHPVLSRIGYSDHITSSVTSTSGRCYPTLCVQAVDVLNSAGRSLRLSVELEPRDIGGWIRRIHCLGLLEFSVPKASDVEVRSGSVDEEVHSNSSGVFTERAKVVVCNGARLISERGNRANGRWSGCRVGASVVLSAGSQSDENESFVRARLGQCAGRLRSVGEIACAAAIVLAREEGGW